MAITLVNSSPFPRQVGDLILHSGATTTVEQLTPAIHSQIASGDLDIGSVPTYQHSIRAKATYPVSDKSGAVKSAVTGHGVITGGADGTDGTFALGFTGGTGTAATGTFVVESGALTTITITTGGEYSVVSTAFDFSASAGLTGAEASVTSAPVAITFAAANSSRTGWTFKNTSNVTLYVDDTGAAASATSPTSRAVAPEGIIGSIDGFSSKAALSVYGATLGKTFTASEW